MFVFVQRELQINILEEGKNKTCSTRDKTSLILGQLKFMCIKI